MAEKNQRVSQLPGSAGIRDGTLCRQPSPSRLPLGRNHILENCDELISHELRSACMLPDYYSSPGAKPQAVKVHAWLVRHQDVIIGAESKWSVDRRAIAGAIAWEALKNVKTHALWSRWSGAGKIHYFQYVETSILEEVIALGYLPASTRRGLKERMADPAQSIDAMGAIMRALADVAAQLGGYCDFYWWPALLANFYNAWNVRDAVRHFTKVKSPQRLRIGNDMARWVVMNLDFIEDAVGRLPDECRSGVKMVPDVKRLGDACIKS